MFYISFAEYLFLFSKIQKYKNRPKNTRVIVENKVARFPG